MPGLCQKATVTDGQAGDAVHSMRSDVSIPILGPVTIRSLAALDLLLTLLLGHRVVCLELASSGRQLLRSRG